MIMESRSMVAGDQEQQGNDAVGHKGVFRAIEIFILIGMMVILASTFVKTYEQ